MEPLDHVFAQVSELNCPRPTKICTIVEGTPEIQRPVIARSVAGALIR